MPQFDFFSFFVQVFTLSLALWIFYFCWLKFFLPKSSFGLKIRIKTQDLREKATLKTVKGLINNKVFK